VQVPHGKGIEGGTANLQPPNASSPPTLNPPQVIYRASQAAGPMAGWVKANLAYAAVLDKVRLGAEL
jgi:hypothetical protein